MCQDGKKRTYLLRSITRGRDSSYNVRATYDEYENKGWGSLSSRTQYRYIDMEIEIEISQGLGVSNGVEAGTQRLACQSNPRP